MSPVSARFSIFGLVSGTNQQFSATMSILDRERGPSFGACVRPTEPYVWQPRCPAKDLMSLGCY